MMSIFSSIYLKILNWAESKHSVYYLSILSFIESNILPYPPPDVLLAPMSLQKPKKAYQFALITTIFSVLGGIVGYFLGDFLLDILLNYHIIKEETVSDIATWFKDYGIYVVAIAAFSPLPFKLACISAGMLSMSFLPFVLISFISRGLRFFLVAFFVRLIGDEVDKLMRKYIDPIGYSLILVLVIYSTLR